MTITLTVPDMMCEHCKASIEGALSAFEGVSAVADPATKLVEITCPEGSDKEKFKAAIIEEGFTVAD